MKKVVAIYHKDCNDGTTAAAVVLKKFPEAEVFPIPRSFVKEDLDPIINILTEDTDIYTVDCETGVKEILGAGFKVTTIDHHVGVNDELKKLEEENKNFTYIFDNDKSGASLSWSYFFPNEKMPELIKFVEDFDLWKWKYQKETEFMGNYLSLFLNQPEKVLEMMNGDLEEIKKKGELISLYTNAQIEDQQKTEPILLKIREHFVPAYNTPMSYKSILGNTFSKKQEKTVVIFKIDGENVKLSFRSSGQNPSALDLATIVGGSGHINSSGAKITLKEFLEMIVR